MKAAVIQEPVVQPDLTSKELTKEWEKLKNIDAVDDLVIYTPDTYPDNETISRIADGVNALFGVWIENGILSESFVLSHPDLRYIGQLGHGWEPFDVEMTRRANLTITNTIYGSQTIAEYAFALLMEVCHHVSINDARLKSIDWADPKNTEPYMLTHVPQIELYGKTCGVIGLGQIGSAFARMANGFGMHVIGYSRHIKDRPDLSFVEQTTDLDDLLRNSDVISLHVPLTTETEHLIDAAAIEKMKDGVILINTARGALIDEQALADALSSGKVAGAGLDVLTEEPPVHGSPLLTAKNCTVTSHLAWLTRESRIRAIDMAIDNFASYLAGKPCSKIN